MNDSHPNFSSAPRHPFPDPQKRDRFLGIVRDYFRHRRRETIVQDDLTAIEPDGMRHHLLNLAQVCSRAPRQAWRGLVREHLDKSARHVVQACAETLAATSFEQIAGQLAVRIYHEDYLVPCKGQVVHRVDLQGTVTVLVFDLPKSMFSVPRPVADEWHVRDDVLFARGLKNIAERRRAKWESCSLPGEPAMPIDYLLGDDYASSHLLCTGGLPRIGAHGNLLGVPRRDVLLSFPIDRLPTMQPVEAMLILATGIFRTGPGSITPHLYWRSADGAFELQQGSVDGMRSHLACYPGFRALCEQLLQKEA